jgi:hypothetical protein
MSYVIRVWSRTATQLMNKVSTAAGVLLLFVVVHLNINAEQKGNALVLKASSLGPVVIRQQTEQSDSHQKTPDGSRGVGGGMDRRDLG